MGVATGCPSNRQPRLFRLVIDRMVGQREKVALRVRNPVSILIHDAGLENLLGQVRGIIGHTFAVARSGKGDTL